ncbi:hypothetical protein CYMTET_32062 [Cymbomonas tetramitiformis]|nr:hypothetical protein CYMTET_32062 [Cymbomonas tetramitiformis]
MHCVACEAPFQMQAPIPRQDNPEPRQAVPQDLIEIQTAYIQESWAVDWKLERQGQSSKISYLLRRLAKLGCERLDSEPATPVAEGSEGPVVPTVASARATRERRMSGQKIIIYSNFATHLHVVDLALNHEFGSRVYVSLFSRKGFTQKHKDAALKAFREQPDARILVLDRLGAEGLDLSFVSHVFLMEPLENGSLEQQVVSRAHRMGQKGTVTVVVMAMRGTAEEDLLLLQQPDRADAPAHSSASELRSCHHILRGLRPIPPLSSTASTPTSLPPTPICARPPMPAASARATSTPTPVSTPVAACLPSTPASPSLSPVPGYRPFATISARRAVNHDVSNDKGVNHDVSNDKGVNHDVSNDKGKRPMYECKTLR